MKKIILLFALCLGMVAWAIAQDEEVVALNSGQEVTPLVQKPKAATRNYLPQAGDIALGVDATPFLTYLGGFFSGSGGTAPTFDGVSGIQGQGIYFKYFLEDTRALRIKLLVDYYSNTSKGTVQNDEAILTTPDATTIDSKRTTTTNVELWAGYEFRRGRGRVQGFWGGELGFGLGQTNDTYTYGNPMVPANPGPSSAFNVGTNPTERLLESKGGLNLAFGVGGFIGVEYFIFNQVALGGELGLRFTASTRGQGESTVQRVENGEVREFSTRTRTATDIANGFGVKTLAGGNIYLVFYF